MCDEETKLKTYTEKITVHHDFLDVRMINGMVVSVGAIQHTL